MTPRVFIITVMTSLTSVGGAWGGNDDFFAAASDIEGPAKVYNCEIEVEIENDALGCEGECAQKAFVLLKEAKKSFVQLLVGRFGPIIRGADERLNYRNIYFNYSPKYVTGVDPVFGFIRTSNDNKVAEIRLTIHRASGNEVIWCNGYRQRRTGGSSKR